MHESRAPMMDLSLPEVKITGENFIPGLSPGRHEDDHLARYRFAAPRAAGLRVLDIACGPGYGSNMLATSGAAEVVGVDISPKMVAYAQGRYGMEKVSFREGSIYDFNAGAPYDFITSFETVEHVPDYCAALKNLFALLKPGGTLLVSSPDRRITTPAARCLSDKPANPFHTQEFTVEELAALLRDVGFEVGSDAVFGQRQQPYFRSDLLNRLYRMWAKPHEKADPNPTPLREGKVPRYFILAAKKPR
jgi:SAM-dependent methyltransferase